VKVDLIKKAIGQFKQFSQEEAHWIGGYKQDIVFQYAEHWDLERLDLASMYEEAIYSEITGRLWGGSRFSPRESMLTFLRFDPHFVRSMFRDLYSEQKDLTLRVQRFAEHADIVAKEIKSKEGRWIDPHHDLEMISLYLALQSPSDYTFFTYSIFKTSMEYLGSRKVPDAFEFGKFTNLSRAIFKIMTADEELTAMYRKDRAETWQPNTMMVHDLYEFINFLQS